MSVIKKRQFSCGLHHGKLNPLPADWKFSSMTPLQCVQCWFIGDLNRNIPPLHSLDSKNVAYLKFGNQMRNKMKCFMRVVEKEARAKGVWIKKKSKADQKAVMRLWEGINPDFTTNTVRARGRRRSCGAR